MRKNSMAPHIPTWFDTTWYFLCKFNRVKEHVDLSSTAMHVHMLTYTIHRHTSCTNVRTGTHMSYHANVRSIIGFFGFL